jgi:hypothetical protein
LDSTEALRLVNRIYMRLNARRPEIDIREQYFNGKQPLNYATAEWKKENASRYADFSDNWSAPVVNAEAERIRYTGMKFQDNVAASNELREHWLLNEMDMQSSQGFVTSLTTARSFVIVWGDSSTDEPIISWEHPSTVEIEYDWEHLRKRKAALKTWVDEKLEYATLYTDDWVFKYQRDRTVIKLERESQAVQSRIIYATNGGWIPRISTTEPWPLRNPMGEVPVVEIPNRPTLMGDPVSEIQGVIPMQDAINLLWAYLFLAADYASMDARVVLGSAPPMIPVLDGTGVKIGEKPADVKELREKRLLYITDPNASIDSFKSASLDVFTNTISQMVGHIAAQTRTPPTYLVSTVGMSNVNGEGLKASEIGVNKKVEEFQLFVSPAMREINRLIALAKGDQGLAKLVRLGSVQWMNPEIRSDAQLADALQKMRAVGYPLEYIMERDGLDEADIQRVLAMKQKEADAATSFAAHDILNGAMNGDPNAGQPNVPAV